ncbi:TldD/PmbA family protein [Clostridium tertium]|uniref:TldD/PmbA family protein n=1 Tax=Clostridium TaxID=1485 RepID=UPI00115A417F|nr:MULTISPECIES: TldD/PmbA family protein [Clostridium]MBS5308363.1 TldD/PmbA family protein [Clostridium sp.]MDB1923748.1 TldD/PmbA family protein [Clostridium tertium]MDB1926769.1 TldD/PmbA family protein [Clostridium tertium]MDB1930397.1 TldD/PmbA family protein [Clostridium tertium]MDB1935073.1 TldD/PmbA family protein [Clostridium tertium]
MELNIFINKLFQEAKNNGFNEYEVYYVDRESLSINAYNEEVEKYNLTTSYGLSFRGKINDKIGYSYTEILDDDAINMLVKNAKESALVIENEDIQFIYEGDKEYAEVNTYYKALENLPADKLIDLALSMEKEAKTLDNRVTSFGGCGIGYSKARYGIINSKGLNLENKSNLLSAYVVPIIKNGEDMHDGMGYVTANSIEDVDPRKLAQDGINEAISRIGGKSVSSGKYKAVINNEAMVSILSTFAGVFSGDAVQKGLSLLKGKEGEIIASKQVTLLDDPHLENGLASVPFDDEGVATKKKDIIHEGKLMTLLHNLKTANKGNTKSTGNGFKNSYASPVGVSPTNLYIQKGEKSFEELLKDVGEGLLITEFAGLHSGANSITGDFSLAAKGFYIKDGKKDYPVEQITVAGNFFDLLKNIEEVGSDLKFPMSSIGSPSVKITELSIAGK